jgi:hypothetical protein
MGAKKGAVPGCCTDNLKPHVRLFEGKYKGYSCIARIRLGTTTARSSLIALRLSQAHGIRRGCAAKVQRGGLSK